MSRLQSFKWDPSLICNACHRDMLTMEILIEKYKKGASDNAKDKIKVTWLKLWKGDLKNPTRNPCQVMKAYLDLLNTTVDNVDEQMCWECNVDEQMCWECWLEDDSLHESDKYF